MSWTNRDFGFLRIFLCLENVINKMEIVHSFLYLLIVNFANQFL